MGTVLLCALFLPLRSQEQPYYLTHEIYCADAAAHVWNDTLYVYASHDIDTGVEKDGFGARYNMRDYVVFTMLPDENGQLRVLKMSTLLDIQTIPWAGRQLWAPDCAYRGGRYYLYFPAKDKTDIFRIGVAVSDTPTGPFHAQSFPLDGSYSIDPVVFQDSDGAAYIYFGGLKGGQLQRYRNNKAIECGSEPEENAPALSPKIALLSADMLSFAEEPRDVWLLDESGNLLKAGDKERRFFEAAWVHKYNNRYYFSYSTGTTHKLCYAIGKSPYGPFFYKGVLLTPVIGWTTHHSIVQYRGKWYLFYHDSKPSGGVNHLRSIKVRELRYNSDGTIQTMNGME